MSLITTSIGIGGKDADRSRTSCPACVSDVQTWSAPRKPKCLLRGPRIRHLVGQKVKALASGGKSFSKKLKLKKGVSTVLIMYLETEFPVCTWHRCPQFTGWNEARMEYVGGSE